MRAAELERRVCMRWVLTVALGVVALAAAVVGAQEQFRVTWDVDRATPGRTRITGRVFNDAAVDVLNVYVTAEALDAGGKVVARGVSFVASSIPPRSNAPFEASVPAPSGGTNVRVRVSSFRFGYGAQQSP